MSLRKSQRRPQPEQQPTEEEHNLLTEPEKPDTSTKVAEGRILESLHQPRDDKESDPVIKNAAEILERSKLRPKLSHKEWYTFLQTVRYSNNLCKDLTQILNKLIATGAAESTYTERGIVDSIILCILQQCITGILFQEDSVSFSVTRFSWWCSLYWLF